MLGSKAVKERIAELIAQAPELSQNLANNHTQMAWLIAAQNTVQLVCPSETNPYHAHAKGVVVDRMARLAFKIEQISALLLPLLELHRRSLR